MKYYPINLDITNKRCVVIGGGRVAERKVESLLKCGGNVTVISPNLTPQLKALLSQGKIDHVLRKYQKGDLQGTFLVFSATDDPLVNTFITREAKREGTLINVVDTPKMCNFIVPSVVDRDDLVISISTNGKSPALAKRIREELEIKYGEEYSVFLAILGAVREKLLKVSDDSERNKSMFYKIADSNILQLIKVKNRDGINSTLKETLGQGYSLEELRIVV